MKGPVVVRKQSTTSANSDDTLNKAKKEEINKSESDIFLRILELRKEMAEAVHHSVGSQVKQRSCHSQTRLSMWRSKIAVFRNAFPLLPPSGSQKNVRFPVLVFQNLIGAEQPVTAHDHIVEKHTIRFAFVSYRK